MGTFLAINTHVGGSICIRLAILAPSFTLASSQRRQTTEVETAENFSTAGCVSTPEICPLGRLCYKNFLVKLLVFSLGAIVVIWIQ